MKKIIWFTAILALCFMTACTSKPTNGDENTSVSDENGYKTTSLSGDNLKLKWRIVDGTTLDAALIGDPQSKGWIGIGFNPSNKMLNAKIILVQNGNDGTSILTANGLNFSLQSTSIDLTNDSVSVSGTEITASFNATISDLGITTGQINNVIWAYKGIDQNLQPVNNVGQHSSRGSTTITFQ